MATAKCYLQWIGDFKPDEETITAYLEQVDLFFDVNGVEEAAKIAVSHYHWREDLYAASQSHSTSSAERQDTSHTESYSEEALCTDDDCHCREILLSLP